MADSKVSALTAITSVAADDEIYVVDKSDTTDDAAGSSKKITAQNLVGRVLLDEITNASAGSFSFSAIPSGFNRLVIEGKMRSDVAATADVVVSYFNADTTDGNYYRQAILADNGTASATEAAQPVAATVSGASSPTGAYGHVRLVIEDYAGSDYKTIVGDITCMRDATRVLTGVYAATWKDTSAITSIVFQTDNDPTDQLVGTLRLYGEM